MEWAQSNIFIWTCITIILVWILLHKEIRESLKLLGKAWRYDRAQRKEREREKSAPSEYGIGPVTFVLIFFAWLISEPLFALKRARRKAKKHGRKLLNRLNRGGDEEGERGP